MGRRFESCRAHHCYRVRRKHGFRVIAIGLGFLTRHFQCQARGRPHFLLPRYHLFSIHCVKPIWCPSGKVRVSSPGLRSTFPSDSAFARDGIRNPNCAVSRTPARSQFTALSGIQLRHAFPLCSRHSRPLRQHPSHPGYRGRSFIGADYRGPDPSLSIAARSLPCRCRRRRYRISAGPERA
jgi:hypothetical protein